MTQTRCHRCAWLLVLTVLFCLLLASPALCANPGSANDPLVTRSWVEQYLNQQFQEIEEQISSLSSQLSTEAIHITLTIGKTTAVVNGQAITLDVAPQLVGAGFTLVPLRFISETLGIEPQWVASERKVVLSKGSTNIILFIDQKEATINGKATQMDYAPIIVNDRTLVHVRFIMEALHCTVDWDGPAKQVQITGIPQ